MGPDLTAISKITPSQYITFAITNTLKVAYLRDPELRIAVLDSPEANAKDKSPRIATIIVPENQEHDWLFCTESGHYHLLISKNVSRLILIGNNLNPNWERMIYIRPPSLSRVDWDNITEQSYQIVMAYLPTVCFRNGGRDPLAHPPLEMHKDDVVYRATVEKFDGPSVGEFVVEDVTFDMPLERTFRRALRFKSMPYLYQSQVPFIGSSNLTLDAQSLRRFEELGFVMKTSTLAQPYLNCMVSGMFMVSSTLDERRQRGISPRALCLGVGGGSLLTFLNTQLGFQVVGVEVDEVVLSAARKYFGLNDGSSVKLIVGDAIELIEKFDNDANVNIDGLKGKFDVVMVDLVSNEGRLIRLNAPPPGFARMSVLQGMRTLIHNHGVLIIHVISPDNRIYETLIQVLKHVFPKVYRLKYDIGSSYVLLATLTPTVFNTAHHNAFSQSLNSVICNMRGFTDTIQEI